MSANEVGFFLFVTMVTVVTFLVVVALLYVLARFLVVAPPAFLERFYGTLRAAGRAAARRPPAARHGQHTPEAVRPTVRATP